jgi:chromosomal replication initiation ATPase DnaA
VATAVAFAVPLTELVAASRGERSVAFARQSAMYLAHVTFGLSYSEIGEVFGRDRTTAAHACRLVEDRREDPAIDALMSSLESACATLHAGLDAALAAERAQGSSRRPS